LAGNFDWYKVGQTDPVLGVRY